MTMTVRVEDRPFDQDSEITGSLKALSGSSSNLNPPKRNEKLGQWRRERKVYRWTAAMSDLVLVSGFSFLLGNAHQMPSTPLLAAGVGIFFVLVVGLNHGYDPRRAASGPEELKAIGRGLLGLSLVMLLVDFVGLVQLAPMMSIVYLLAAAASVVVARLVQRRVARRLRIAGRLSRRTLVIGSVNDVASVMSGLDGARHGFDVVGACVPAAADAPERISTVAVWGDLRDAADLIAKHRIDAVVVSSGAMDVDQLRQFRWAIEDLDTEILIAPNLNEVLSDRVSLRALSTMPLLTVTSGPSRPQKFSKDVMDRVLAALLLIVAGPVIGVAALAVRMTSPGGAIFRQQRIGEGGRPFTMFKLRSMVTDAESLKAALAAEGNKGGGALFKLADDPRITPVGKVIRRFSIDELPQIWNVLRGDMSLVGPRPPLPSEVATYDDMAAHRLQVKPGLTGLWQVSGRANLSWEESVKLDLRYIDNFSLGRDIKILARTFRAVFGASGAY